MRLFFQVILFFCFSYLGFAECPNQKMIFVNTVPKSGSCYIVATLENTLKDKGYRFVRISMSRVFRDFVDQRKIVEAMQCPFIAQEHIDASDYNLYILERFFSQFVLHVRDPRQATLSWLYHVENYQKEHYSLWDKEICPPDEYFFWSLNEKIDWQIENYLPQLVHWLEQWIQIIDSKRFNIMVTRFEDMIENSDQFFSEILKFYDSDSTPQMIGFQPGRLHQRKGEADEWKTAMSDKQIQRMHEIIPLTLLERFGWN